MSKLAGWPAVGIAALAFGFAMLLWGLAPASECGTPHEIRWPAGFLPFLVFLAAGSQTVVRGDVAQRLVLFVTVATTIAAYTWLLSRSVPMVIQTEISCAARAHR